MMIQLNWLDDNKIHIRFEHGWTLDDFQEMVLLVRDMIRTKSHLVHVIADFTHSSTPSSAALIGIPFAVRHIEPNQGAAIVLTHNEIISRLAKTAISMHSSLRQWVYVVNSLDASERIFAHVEKQKAVFISSTHDKVV